MKSHFHIVYMKTPNTPVLETCDNIFAIEDFIEDYNMEMKKLKTTI